MNKILSFRRGRSRIFLLATLLLLPAVFFLAGWGGANAQTMNGFDVSESTVPLSEIHRGGPPRDGIPALTDPEFLLPADQHWLQEEDRVLGVHRNGVAKAYPLGIMNYH